MAISLLVAMPGSYLEFPSDPVAHLSRIHEWFDRLTISEHEAGAKMSYFLAYSWIRPMPVSWTASAITVYSFGCALLLLLAYFRLARTAGIPAGLAVVAVVAQVILFGNNVFSFLRYYGLSSSIFAQIGVIALLERAIRLLRERERSWSQSLAEGCAWVGLSFLIYLNHVQGFAIIAVGLGSLLAWRLAEWKRWSVGAMLALYFATAAIPMWLFRTVSITPGESVTWLTSWGSFDVFAPGNPASVRVMEIVGWFGLVNVAAGVLLVLRNDVLGWMTCGPLLLMIHPVVSIAVCAALSSRGPDQVAVFHRLLFAIPFGFAVLGVLRNADVWLGRRIASARQLALRRFRFAAPAMVGLVGLAAALVTPPGRPGYSRLWHALAASPKDSSFGGVHTALESSARESRLTEQPRLVLAHGAYAMAAGVSGLWGQMYESGQARRLVGSQNTPASAALLIQSSVVSSEFHQGFVLLAPNPPSHYTPRSVAGIASGHWIPSEALLSASGSAEMEQLAASLDLPELLKSSRFSLYGQIAPQSRLDVPLMQIAPAENHVYSGRATLILPLTSGHIAVRADAPGASSAWAADLLWIDGSRHPRAIYLYAVRRTGEVFLEVFGERFGPWASPLQDGFTRRHLIEVTWTRSRQQVVVNGQLIGSANGTIPLHQRVDWIHLGWTGRSQESAWFADLVPDLLQFGGRGHGNPMRHAAPVVY